MFLHQNNAAGGGNGSIMVEIFLCLCLASQNLSQREFFIPARTDLGVKLLTHVEQVWLACPKGCIPILLGDLNVDLPAACNERDEMIAEQVETMALLVGMSSHFRQRHRRRSRGQWTGWMRRSRDPAAGGLGCCPHCHVGRLRRFPPRGIGQNARPYLFKRKL